MQETIATCTGPRRSDLTCSARRCRDGATFAATLCFPPPPPLAPHFFYCVCLSLCSCARYQRSCGKVRTSLAQPPIPRHGHHFGTRARNVCQSRPCSQDHVSHTHTSADAAAPDHVEKSSLAPRTRRSHHRPMLPPNDLTSPKYLAVCNNNNARRANRSACATSMLKRREGEKPAAAVFDSHPLGGRYRCVATTRPAGL